MAKRKAVKAVKAWARWMQALPVFMRAVSRHRRHQGADTMTPVEFPEQNCVFAKDQPEYIPLPAHRGQQVTTSCWSLTWRERFAVLFYGHIWLQQMNFGQPLQPQRPFVNNPLEQTP